MSISVNWATKVITIPQSYLTPKGGSVYELDLDVFRLDLKSLEDSEAGMPFLDTHRHTTETVLGGITYSRFVEMINGYTVTFEDGQYIVNLVGANSNVSDTANLNQVSIRSANSAGMITVVQGSGVTEQDKLDIATAVAEKDISEFEGEQTLAGMILKIRQFAVGRWKVDKDTKIMTIYDVDKNKPLIRLQLLDENGNPTLEGIYERVPLDD